MTCRRGSMRRPAGPSIGAARTGSTPAPAPGVVAGCDSHASFLGSPVDVSAVADRKYRHDPILDLQHDSVVAHAQLSIRLQGLPQGLRVQLGMFEQPSLNRSANSIPYVPVYLGKVDGSDVRVVTNLIERDFSPRLRHGRVPYPPGTSLRAHSPALPAPRPLPSPALP